MPNIKATGFTALEVQKISKLSTEKLAKAVGCPLDWITFIAETTEKEVMFSNGEVVRDTVFLQVEWFDRGQEMKDLVAKILTDVIMELSRCDRAENEGIETIDIFFVDMEKTNYYENGTHF